MAFMQGGNNRVPTGKIFSNTINILEKSLNIRSIQHKALSANAANMDTPNYKTVELDVTEKTAKQRESGPGLKLVRTRPNHLPIKANRTDSVTLKAVRPPGFSLRGDGNTVDIDRTMGKLAENNLLYNATALATGKQTNIHQTMIAAEKADVSFELLMQIRNKLVAAYDKIMRMQV
jgi:flagellar basal-body rod protein FlgB